MNQVNRNLYVLGYSGIYCLVLSYKFEDRLYICKKLELEISKSSMLGKDLLIHSNHYSLPSKLIEI